MPQREKDEPGLIFVDWRIWISRGPAPPKIPEKISEETRVWTGQKRRHSARNGAGNTGSGKNARGVANRLPQSMWSENPPVSGKECI